MQLKGKQLIDKNGDLIIGYTIEQVAVLIGRSTHCIQYWYKWAEENPDAELANMLPEYIQIRSRSTRYWTKDGINQLRAFRRRVPQGRPKKETAPMLKQAILHYYHSNKLKGENNAES